MDADQPHSSPPTTLIATLRQIGPGLITAGAVVGSGELIATTKTGAQAGFWLLWLVIIGCVIKVFVQVELGRYAISSGESTIAALDRVPGPRLGVSLLLWYWLLMFVVSIGQLGGVIYPIGQAMAMNLPLDGSYNQLLDEQAAWRERAAQAATAETSEADVGPMPDWRSPGYYWTDDVWWAGLLTLGTVAILVTGRYSLVQNLSAALVAAFTAVTVFCVFALQARPEWAIHARDLAEGLSFRLPPASGGGGWAPLATALATFGIIGVGTNELVAYPYWCLEKGYARQTGPREGSPQWAERARGWLRVMRTDALVSMAIYTFATLAFYLLGAAVLHRQRLNPSDSDTIAVLSAMYVPVFGGWTRWFFLLGAFAVLYSTFFAASAGHARISADATRVFGLGARSEAARRWWVRAYSIIIPLVALAISVVVRQPIALILTSGVMQGMMLPMLAGAALYFRYHRCDRRITPGRLWDAMLWLSAAGMLVSGGWTAYSQLSKLWSP